MKVYAFRTYGDQKTLDASPPLTRTSKIGAVCGAIVGSVLLFAPIASAHHPVVVASLACNGTVTFTITADLQDSTRDNSDVELTDTSGGTQPAATGAFERANDWSFSGTFVLPTSVTSDTLTPQARGIWGDRVQPSNGPSTTITRPSNCPRPTPVTPPVTASAPPVTAAAPFAAPAAPSNPAIAISKSPKSQTIASGSTATFTIVVTNTGDVLLTNVFVTDALSPDCVKTTATTPALSSMPPGASLTYTCVTAAVIASFTNVATDTGTPPTGPNVTATDTASVVVTAPFLPPTPSVVKPGTAGHQPVRPVSGSSSYSETYTAPFTPPTISAAKPKLVGDVAPTTTG